MSTQPRLPIDRAAAERLLDGARSLSPGDPHLLAGLLTASTAPALPHELAGEEATVAAFRAARHSPVPRPGRARTVKSSVLRLFTVKVAILAATATGGVAIAASTGTLPISFARDRMAPAPPQPAPEVPPAKAKPGDRTAPVDAPRPPAPAAPTSVGGAPAPALVGLCRAYTAQHSAEKRAKLLDRPAFAPLITAAGGRDHVDAYCDRLLADLSTDGPGKGPKEEKDKDPKKRDKKDPSRRATTRGGAGEGAQP